VVGDRAGEGRLEGQDLDVVLRQLRGHRPAVQPRALAAPHGPLLAGAEVVHVAEVDVAHRRPVGDGDRERVERDAPLGVDRAVDGVDHDPDGAAAEAPDTELLRYERERAVERLEPLDHLPLRGVVDGGGVVAAHPRS
jgi:hypothetical protein